MTSDKILNAMNLEGKVELFNTTCEVDFNAN